MGDPMTDLQDGTGSYPPEDPEDMRAAIKTLTADLEAARADGARLAEKVKRLQGELSHDEHCKADEMETLDVDRCGTCMTLADFGITETDITATPTAAPARSEPGLDGVEWCVCETPKTVAGFCTSCGLPRAARADGGS